VKKQVAYSPELGERVCREIAITTRGLTAICKENPDFPARDTIYMWRLDHPEFAAIYNEAKRIQADLFVEEIIEISDDIKNDNIENKDGSLRPNKEWIMRSKLKVDSRKWIACKLLPKVYGDKFEGKVEHTGQEVWLDKLK